MAGTQVGGFDAAFLQEDLGGLPLADPHVAAAPLPAPPPHPPPRAQDDCTAPAAASTVVAPGWKDITEKAAENIDTRQRAPIRKGVTRPFPGFTPARGKGERETWKEYLLGVYAECLQEDPKPDPEHEGCSLNYGGARNGCMARVCVACRWMTEKNLGAHLASDKHRHKVELHKLKGQKREAEGAAEEERQKRRKVEESAAVAKEREKKSCLVSVSKNPGALEFAPQEFRADKEFMLQAVAIHGCALEYASEELRADREVVMRAVAHDERAMAYASRELWRDREFVLAVAAVQSVDQTQTLIVEFASRELWEDKEVMAAIYHQLIRGENREYWS
eukprot:COSAG01_NODE_6215_length_3788_cov_25.233085_1_plen_333_part_10